MSETLKAFRYMGSKLLLAKTIAGCMPPHHTYVEPFGGSGAVLLNKKPSPVEIFNDIDGNIYNFFKVCRDPVKFRRLMRLLYYTPYCQRTFAEAIQKFKNKSWKDDVERAWGWKVICEMSCSGDKESLLREGSWQISNTTPEPRRWQNSVIQLKLVHRRLSNVMICNRDALQMIPDSDGKHVLFYCDPPYISETRKDGAYIHEADTIEFHQRLVDLLLNLKGMCLLSCYWHPVYEPLLKAGWVRMEFERHAGRWGRANKRTEILLLSPRVAAYGATPDLFQSTKRHLATEPKNEA